MGGNNIIGGGEGVHSTPIALLPFIERWSKDKNVSVLVSIKLYYCISNTFRVPTTSPENQNITSDIKRQNLNYYMY